MVRLPILALSILVSSALATAQTVMEGAVQDLSGNPIHDAKVVLQHTNGVPAQISNTNSNGRFQFAAVDAGAYQIKTDASGFYPALYELTVRPRQAISLTIELQPAQAVQQTVEVKELYRTVDPEKTGSSQTFTREDLEALPDPLVENTNNLVANLMPGASTTRNRSSARE